MPDTPSSGRLSAADVAHVARLARLDLDAEQLERATVELDDMLGHFADIDALELDDVEPMNQPYPLTNVLRPDDPADTLDRDEVMASAPLVEDGRFRVPPILGSEG